MRLSTRNVGALLLVSIATSLRADISAGSPAFLPPQVEPITVRALRGEQVIITLRGHYSGAAPLRFAIAGPPAHGRLSDFLDLGDNRARVAYTAGGKGGKEVDGFSYVAQAGGRVSSPAEVSITIEDASARLEVPAQLDFGEVMAGKSATRQLSIRNAGGGILSGRLTTSSPWQISAADYRVAAGLVQNVTLVFQPSESKDFVGQVTLTEGTREVATVLLGGRGLTLENPTPSAPATPIGLPWVATKDTPNILAREPPKSSLHAETPLPSKPTLSTNKVTAAPTFVLVPTPAAEGTPKVPLNTAVKITVHRLGATDWELRWPADKTPGTMYRLEERLLSLDHSEDLKVAWRELVGPKLNLATSPIVAPIRRLNARDAHFLRLTALNREGAPLWESPLIVLDAEPAPSRRQFFWLVVLGGALGALLFFRWRERHVPA